MIYFCSTWKWRASASVTPAHQEDGGVRICREQRRQLEHPDGGGQGLEEAVDDDDQLGDGAPGHQLGHAVPRLVVGQEVRVQLAGQVLPLEDHVGSDDVPAHRERHVEERGPVLECPVNLRAVP